MKSSYACTQCAQPFKDLFSLSRHTKGCHFGQVDNVPPRRSEPIRPSAAEEQPTSFMDLSVVMSPVLSLAVPSTTISGATFACGVCGKTFSLRGNLNRHKVIHTGAKPFACDACDQSFNRKGNLSMHKMRHHAKKTPLEDGSRNQVAKVATKSRVMRCSKLQKPSNKVATTKDQRPAVRGVTTSSPVTIAAAPVRRKRALVDATTTRSKLFVCNVCGRKYAHSFILRRHQLSHGTDRHTCEVCGQQFTRKDSLNDHVAVKHTGAKLYKCSSCPSSFALRRFLTNHIKRHHQKQNDEAMDCCDSPGDEVLSGEETSVRQTVTLSPINLSAAFDELDASDGRTQESTSGIDVPSEPAGDAHTSTDAVAESDASSKQVDANRRSDSAASASPEDLAAANEDIVSVPICRLLELDRSMQQLASYVADTADPEAIRLLIEHEAAIQQLLKEAKVSKDENLDAQHGKASNHSKGGREVRSRRVADSDDDDDLPVRNVIIDVDENIDWDEYIAEKMEFQRNFAERRKRDEQEFGPAKSFEPWPRVHADFEEELEDDS